MIFARKNAGILHDYCAKNIFSLIFGGICPPAPPYKRNNGQMTNDRRNKTPEMGKQPYSRDRL